MIAIKKFAVLLAGILILLGNLNVFADPAEIIEDTVITTNIKTKMLANKEVSGLQISVETKNGVVTLTGDVKSDQEGSTVIEIAASTPGVTDVDASNLKVESSSQPFADAIITAKVKGAFLREKLFGEAQIPVVSIHVETQNGTVYLTGEAENAKQAQKAEELAKLVNGVKSVVSTITVK